MKKNKEREIETQIKSSELVVRSHQQIALDATKLFIKKGFFKMGIREISRATGITIGNLYDYIRKKIFFIYSTRHK